jgi:hypothetical protein
LSGFFIAWRKVMTAVEKDRDILAHTLWGEARGEGLIGQIGSLDDPQPRERRQGQVVLG